ASWNAAGQTTKSGSWSARPRRRFLALPASRATPWPCNNSITLGERPDTQKEEPAYSYLVCHEEESRISTTSESVWPRSTHSFLPSGDQWKFRIWSESNA